MEYFCGTRTYDHSYTDFLSFVPIVFQETERKYLIQAESQEQAERIFKAKFENNPTFAQKENGEWIELPKGVLHTDYLKITIVDKTKIEPPRYTVVLTVMPEDELPFLNDLFKPKLLQSSAVATLKRVKRRKEG